MKRLVFTLLFGISVLAAAAQEFGQVCTEKVPDEIHHFDRYKVNSQFYDADLIKQKNDRGVQRWFCNDTIMDGFYRGVPYIEYYGPSVFDGFDLRYSVYKFKDGIRNDTVTVNGELFLNTTGKPGRESSVEPSQENCLIVRSRIRGLRICILNNNTELLFMCIARESCVSRRPQKAAVFLYISVFWKYMKRGR